MVRWRGGEKCARRGMQNYLWKRPITKEGLQNLGYFGEKSYIEE